MYFDHRQSLDWFDRIADIAREHEGIRSGAVELFVIPSFLSIPAAITAFAGTRVAVGAQDLFWHDTGAFTGEVSGRELAEVGVQVVEVGHAERRRLFAESDEIVAAKAAAALRNNLTPVLCIGEESRGSAAEAIESCGAQLDSALDGAPSGSVIVAYEPVWAIGADRPAEPDYIREICSALRDRVAAVRPGSNVIYGGSAGPNLLTQLGGDVDGIFLGRFAHDPVALAAVLDEALTRSS